MKRIKKWWKGLPAGLRDTLTRALKTAVQAFGGIFTGDAIFDLDISTIEMAAGAGVSAAISVVWNAILQWSAT